MSTLRMLSVALLALALVAGAAWALQSQTATVLRQEIALLGDDNRQLARVRAENERLKAAQTPAAELERLRADHAAIARLRTEIEGMKARAEQRSREVAAPVPPALPPSTKPAPPPALSLSLGVALDGSLSLDGNALDLSLLKQRLAGLAKGDRVDVRLRMPEPGQGAPVGEIKRGTESSIGDATENGLRMSVQMERAGK